MKTTCPLPIFLLLTLCFFSCKEKTIKTSPVEFYLMDSPSNYDAVNIHVKEIEAAVLSDSLRWIPLHTKDTTVNLLHFQDSITLMIAHGLIPQGILKQIHFALGNDNTIVVTGNSYPLQTGGNGSGDLFIQVDKNLNETFNGFILDFDASGSIIEENGSYRLQPVVRVIQ